MIIFRFCLGSKFSIILTIQGCLAYATSQWCWLSQRPWKQGPTLYASVAFHTAWVTSVMWKVWSLDRWSLQTCSGAPDPTFSVSGPLAERYPGRQCSIGRWYITVSQDICPPMANGWIYITQHARIHTFRTSSSTSSSRWRSRIARWLSVLHQYTASPLRPFLGTRVRIPRKSHIN